MSPMIARLVEPQFRGDFQKIKTNSNKKNANPHSPLANSWPARLVKAERYPGKEGKAEASSQERKKKQ